jgi:adenosine deaminase CECR1
MDLVRVMDEEIKGFMNSDEGKGFWGARLIWDTLRSFDKEVIIKGLVISRCGKMRTNAAQI